MIIKHFFSLLVGDPHAFNSIHNVGDFQNVLGGGE